MWDDSIFSSGKSWRGTQEAQKPPLYLKLYQNFSPTYPIPPHPLIGVTKYLPSPRTQFHFGISPLAHLLICLSYPTLKCPVTVLDGFQINVLFEWAFIVIQDNQALGIGSGSTIVFAVERIGELLLVSCILFSNNWDTLGTLKGHSKVFVLSRCLCKTGCRNKCHGHMF